jgi:hypothetical protein
MKYQRLHTFRCSSGTATNLLELLRLYACKSRQTFCDPSAKPDSCISIFKKVVYDAEDLLICATVLSAYDSYVC